MTTTGSVNIQVITLKSDDPTKTSWGANLSAQYHFVIANGTVAAETFDAGDIPQATLDLMALWGRGVVANMGDGDDTVIGSSYGDSITGGAGTNRIDGGSNLGLDPNGVAGRDVLNVLVSSQAEADAVTVSTITQDGADAAYYAEGYRIKVVSSATGETSYLKNVEKVDIFVNNVFSRSIELSARITEASTSSDLANYMHLAWVQGTGYGDTFNAATDISSDTQGRMTQYGRGIWIDGGAGDDSLTGSAYGDDITGGEGTNYVDGGANGGTPPYGGKAQDVLHVRAANQSDADAVTVTQLTSGLSGVDATAFSQGYTHKVVNGANVDYIKGIERVSVELATGSFVRDIALAVVVQEANVADSNIANYYHLSWTHGTAGADTIDLSGDSTLFSSALKAAMDTNKRGAWVDGGAGNDIITGTAYGDNFVNGAGNAKIDGGAHGAPSGSSTRDVFEIRVDSDNAMSAVTIAASDDPDYQWMVTYGTGEKDYLKNIEAVVVSNTNGGSSRWIPLAVEVGEASGSDIANYMHFAWAHGTENADTFNATTDISSATRTLMDTHQRGVWIDTGNGSDTITGSAYGDDINAGEGNDYIDGGANNGTAPWGSKAQDVLHIRAGSQAAVDAVAVLELTSGMSGADAAAFTAGYTHKVVNGSETDYIKGIERVMVQLVVGDTYSFGRDIPLTVVVNESNLSDPNVAQYYHLSYTHGTAGNDNIDLSASGAMLSPALQAAMVTHKHGAWVDGGAGNDTITGTAYGDNFRNGSGNARIDGGANAGPDGSRAQDIFEITVANADELSAVTVAASDDSNYQWMVTYGTGQKDYLKNIEAVVVNNSGGSGFRWIPLAVNVNEIGSADQAANFMHFAWANGTDQADTFNAAADVSAATRALMDTHQRGVWVDLGAGNDTVTGSGYGDDITVGAGTNYVDGGAQAGSPPWGGKSQDVLHITATSQAAADAITVTALASGMSGDDAAAFTAGYTHKVVNGAEIDYIKNIERISVQVFENNSYSYGRDFPLAVSVQEANLSDSNIAQYYHLSYTQGTDGADTIDLSGDSALFSSALKTAMATHKHGAWVDGGKGNDVITGTAYGDNFRNGSGNAKIDGGANEGPGGTRSRDMFEISVDSTDALAAVTVAASDDPDYQWMVTYGTGQKDYLKNIEAVIVNVNNGSGSRYIPLAMDVNEVAADNTQLANYMHFAWAQGTDQADSFNATTDISSATRALMDTHQRGVYVDTGAGDDTVTGSAYGDNFTVGAGTNRVDGGDNIGAMPWGGKAQDVLQITVASQAESDAVAVTQLTSGMSGNDAGAFSAGYTHKVVHANGVDYIKGIERINVNIVANNTYSFGRDIPLTVLVQEADLGSSNLENYYHMSWTNGTDGADTIDLSSASTILSSGLKTAMDTYKHGGWVNGGGGNDTITGSAYSDNFVNGAGNARIDGGANTAAAGFQGQDTFEIRVATAEAMAAVSVTTSDDPNYQWMVTYGTGEKDYLKNVETVIVMVENGSGSRWIPLAVNVHEISATDANLSNMMHFAWVSGTEQGDSFNAATDISAATRALMDTHQRGVYIDTGAGNDTITGSGFGDDIHAGTGTNYVDGGANSGSLPWGGKAQDVLQVTVSSQAESDALSVTNLASGMSGTDAAAFAAGYTHKVTSANAVNYIKGIERITVQIIDGNNYSFGRDIPLSILVREVDLASENLGNFYHLSWTDGTDGNDNIDLSDNSTLLSSGVQGAMDTHKRGVWVNGGKGDDTIVGSAYADNFSNGAGNSKIDGGANAGPSGYQNIDMFEISVANADAMAAVTVAPSDDSNYQWMVTYGTGEKDYLKNIEAIFVSPANGGMGRYIPLGLQVSEVAPSDNMANNSIFAFVTGTDFADTISADSAVSAATRTLMDTHQRGVYINGGAGNDTITGSAYGDDISGGAGTNYIDGGADIGVMPWGAQAVDTLTITAADQAAADAVSVTTLVAGMEGADGQAQANGYTHKVVNGSETNYVKGIERLIIQAGNTGKVVNLQVTVDEMNLSDPNIGSYSTLGTVMGTAFNDNIDVSANSALLSNALRTAMDTHKRGVVIVGGAGNDTITGSAYADFIQNGAGNSRVDGGANTAPNGTTMGDSFEIMVANEAALGSVQVAVSDDPDYQWMVTYGTGEKDYLKNIESISVFPSAGGMGRFIPLTVQVNELPAFISDLTNFSYIVNVNGTAYNDTFDAASNISPSTLATMASLGRGVQVDLGAGNDTITGSAYSDDFTPGVGTNYVDGGAHGGSLPFNGTLRDTLQMYVPSQAALDALAVVPLTSGMSGQDAAAFAAGYTYRVSNGTTEVNYIKNIEQLVVTIWDDKDNDGIKEYFGPGDARNELAPGKAISLQPNTAPSFTPAAGNVVQSPASGLLPFGGVVQADGKLLTAAGLSEADGGYNVVLALTRTNPDGSPDASFGVNGISRVEIPLYNMTAPVVQADGKVVIGLTNMASGSGDFSVIRLLANGSVDTAFGVNGIATVAINGEHDEVRSVMVQSDGKIVLAGLAHNNGDRDFAVARVNADGSVDTSFNGTGKLTVAIGAGQDQANVATLTTDGKIVLVGRSVIGPGNRDLTAIRVNQDGTLDAGFGTGGKVMLSLPSDDIGLSVRALADGKLMVGGQFGPSTSMLVRLGSDGSLDSTWGNGGKLATAVAQASGPVYDIAVQPDGKVLALGNYGPNLVVKRYNADGTLDFQFGNGGRVVIEGRGGFESPKTLLLSGDKIVVIGSTDLGDGGLAAQVLVRLNANGTMDGSFGQGQASSLGGAVTANGVIPQQLDRNAAVYDAEMGQFGFSGATLVLQRQGGANADDVFSFINGATVVDGVLNLNGVLVAAVTQSPGRLQLTFLADAYQYMVGQAIHAIAYANSNSSTTPGSVALEWTFSDGNNGAQGLGGALSTTAVTTVQIGVTVVEAVRQLDDPTMGIWNELLATRNDFATANGTARADVFNASSGFSPAVQALMSEFKRGAVIDTGGGNDTVVGTPYNDMIIPGSGVNYVDGGANQGRNDTDIRIDEVRVFVTDVTAGNAVRVVAVGAQSEGADLAAFQLGYEAKVVNGNDVTYIRNIENVTVWTWNDTNGNGVRDDAQAFVGQIRTSLVRTEVSTGSVLAFATGSFKDEGYNAATDISMMTQTMMAANKLGVVLDMAAGDDTVVGSPWADSVTLGTGTNHYDGAGHMSNTNAVDNLQVYVPDLAAAQAVTVTELAAGMSGADAAAFAAGYKYKVLAGAETDYLKDVERVDIRTWVDKDADTRRDQTADASTNEVTFVRSILLAAQVNETMADATTPANSTTGQPLANISYFVNVAGTQFDDQFSVGSKVSSTAQALMTQHQRGVYADLGAGNDVVVGSDFGDLFVLGGGTNYADGGLNLGTTPGGAAAKDTVDLFLANAAEASQVQLTGLTGTLTGVDAEAAAQGYTHKVVFGSQVNYLRNIEQLHVQVWNDLDSDGFRDYAADASNEVTSVELITIGTPTT